MRAADLALLHQWLQRSHVRRWWNEPETFDGVVERYLPAVEGVEPTDSYIVLSGDAPIGYIQTYRVEACSDYGRLVDAEEGAAGVDLFIADSALTGRGVGTALLRQFVSEVVFADPAVTYCIADPELDNRASVRAFEKAGFRVVKEFRDPGDGNVHVVVRRDRED
jgi:RimJ/RimL family protein N-acetyltransferase